MAVSLRRVGARTRISIRIGDRIRVKVRVRVRVRVRTIFERRSGDQTRVDGVRDFEKVRVRVRVRARRSLRV